MPSKVIRRYLKVPYDILQRTDVKLADKLVYAHIYSFGLRGCWESNERMGRKFGIGASTVSRSVRRLYKIRAIYVASTGFYRRMWAVTHPEVKDSPTLPYGNKEISKAEARYNGEDVSTLPNQIDEVGLSQNDAAPNQIEQQARQDDQAPNQIDEVSASNQQTTTINTIIETKKETTATPSPLPARRQAPALLKDRENQRASEIKRFKDGFGTDRRKSKLLSEREFQDRRQGQVEALLKAGNDKRI